MSNVNQVNLNLGSYPYDPSADSIVTTFSKVQQNFTTLFNYLNAPAGSVLTQGNFGAWFSSLPTTLPSTAGQPWNDGGVLSIS
jgi:hypothetical protein